MSRPRILSSEEVEWAYKKWCDGYTVAQISKALYVSNSTVNKSLKGRKRERTILVYEG